MEVTGRRQCRTANAIVELRTKKKKKKKTTKRGQGCATDSRAVGAERETRHGTVGTLFKNNTILIQGLDFHILLIAVKFSNCILVQGQKNIIFIIN